MSEWTPKQHIEHQQLMARMERERNESKVVPEPVVRKKRKKKTTRKQRAM